MITESRIESSLLVRDCGRAREPEEGYKSTFPQQAFKVDSWKLKEPFPWASGSLSKMLIFNLAHLPFLFH